MAKNYVCDGAKIECQLCTKPEGKLIVTSNDIKLQDKKFANAKDKEKTNLIFEGNCKKSWFQASPCASVIKPEEWQDVGDLIVQDAPALLESSTIMCGYGGVPIKIIDHLQKSEPTQLQPVSAPVLSPSFTPTITALEWKSNKEVEDRKKNTMDTPDETIDKTTVGTKVWLEAFTHGIMPGEQLYIEVKEESEVIATTTAYVDEEGKVTVGLKSGSEEEKHSKLTAKAIYDESTTAEAEIQVLPPIKKFMVNFRRPSDYNGKYGFDWLRDEYIYPIETVTNDNNGTPIGTPTALCKNIAALETEYKTTDVKNPISPYGKDYYPAWLSIFPHTTTAQFAHGSRMHRNGVDLDIEIEEIEALVSDDTELVFESGSPFIKITPEKLKLKDLIGTKKTKNLGGTTTRDYYLAKKKVNIKCAGGALTSHEEIKVFAQLGSQKEEVGKLMMYKNNVIPKAEIVAVNVITGSSSASLRNDYQYLFKNQSFNQALIRAEVKVDTEFNLLALNRHADVNTFLTNMNTMSASQIRSSLESLYIKYGRHKPSSGQIDDNTTTRTYLFYTDLNAGRTSGICSLDSATNTWGNHYVIFNQGLNSKRTVIHECGHSLSLPHIFSTALSPFEFYHGYTDNYMDYEWQKGNAAPSGGYFSSGDNKYKGNMYSFFKWQWNILRTDRSLIFTY